MKTQLQTRLAWRVEGDMWNAYCAKPDTMDGALLVASIRITLVLDNGARERYRLLLQKMLGAQIKQVFGAEPEWPEPHPAPEHERGGNA